MPKGSGKDYVSVKIDPDVYRKAKTVASWQDKFIGDYLSEVLGPVMSHEIDKMQREMTGGQSSDEDNGDYPPPRKPRRKKPD